MQVKLLKKVRKRYNWYLNSNGFPVLMDHRKKEVTVIDLEYYRTYFKYETIQEVKEAIQVPEQTVCWRLLLTIMLKDFGYTIGNRWYRIAMNKSKRHKNYSL